ncbi:MAG: DUF4340 domain-containing protein [Candidatus Neomarinimicrobiota bacterium]
MGKNTRTFLIVAAVLVAAFLFNNYLQDRYTTSSKAIFSGDKADIVGITISKTGEAIRLEKSGDNWSISGHDSLVVRQPRLDNLFDKVLTVEHETLVSRNPEKWPVYAVDDSLGLRLQLFDAREKTLGDFYFGRSKSDWSHNYFRQAGKNEVFLTNTNVLYQLNTTVAYWGEKPKPPEPDSTAVDQGALPVIE